PATGNEVPMIFNAPAEYTLAPGFFNGLPRLKFTLKVPPGKYSFRLAHHNQSNLTGSYQRTSTYVLKTVELPTVTSVISNDKEIIVDLCSGVSNNRKVYDDRALVICDLSA